MASDGGVRDSFGHSVAAAGATIVVGAYEADTSLGNQSGTAYVFVEPPTGWSGTLTERDQLFASDGQAGDRFGASVGLSAQTLVVGASNDDASRGSAYLFSNPNALFSDGFESGSVSAWSSSVQ